MSLANNIQLESANIDDVNDILNLYRLVYGKKYPISYGNDPDLLKKTIEDKESRIVLVAREKSSKKVVGAIVVELDKYFKIGKLLGLVVHPDFQKHKIGKNIIHYVTNLLLETNKDINSLYATTRTVTVGPQVVFIKNGYIPLGIFPNAHRLHQYETVTLFAKFRKGILENRIPEKSVLKNLMPLYDTLKSLYPGIKIPNERDESSITKMEIDNEIDFEIIRAPSYVLRKFHERFPKKDDRFFPFHLPNMLIADKEGKIEIFAHFSKRDGYCTLIKSTIPINELNSRLTSLYMQLDDLGVAYLEVLVNVKHSDFIGMLLRGQFVPSAIYPAMREADGKYEDYIILSRTMEPLNFRGMAIVSQFKPYIDQYVDAWKRVNLDTIEIIYEK